LKYRKGKKQKFKRFSRNCTWVDARLLKLISS
jgi:hypothetical protein